MTSKPAAVVAICALLSSGCAIHLSGFTNNCDLTAARNATVEVGDATRVRVKARGGALEIDGRPNLSEVRIAGTACADDQGALDRIELVAERDGSDLLIEARTQGTDGRLALVIELPDSLPVVVDDTSGSIRISRVAAVAVDDSSGSIRLDEIAGDVTVKDESGSIDIDEVAGSVTIMEDGSGGIDINGVEGSVTIEDDGSGGIDISDVRQNVMIEEDGSGGIYVSDVGGDFVVRRDGSGGIRHDRVDGQVSTPSN
jgi:hypothetical protein